MTDRQMNTIQLTAYQISFTLTVWKTLPCLIHGIELGPSNVTALEYIAKDVNDKGMGVNSFLTILHKMIFNCIIKCLSYDVLQYCLTDEPEKRPFEPEKTTVQSYPITKYQPVYFVANSFQSAKEKVR